MAAAEQPRGREAHTGTVSQAVMTTRGGSDCAPGGVGSRGRGPFVSPVSVSPLCCAPDTNIAWDANCSRNLKKKKEISVGRALALRVGAVPKPSPAGRGRRGAPRPRERRPGQHRTRAGGVASGQCGQQTAQTVSVPREGERSAAPADGGRWTGRETSHDSGFSSNRPLPSEREGVRLRGRRADRHQALRAARRGRRPQGARGEAAQQSSVTVCTE